MAKHRAKFGRPYPLRWEWRAFKNRWYFFWMPALKKKIGRKK